MVLILTSVVTLSVSLNKATTVLYDAIQEVEIYGYDVERINKLATLSNTTITVIPVDCDKGFQYEVKVCFDHSFAFINKTKVMQVNGLTRILD